MKKNKECKLCNEIKPRSDFYLRSKKKLTIQAICKICSINRNKQYVISNPDKIRQAKRKEYRKNELRYREYNLKRTYGIDLHDYNKMLAAQNGACAICKKSHTIRKNKRLDVDHDHETGKVRGLLCSYCNQVIGDAKEDIVILENAITYLKIKKGS
jgi:hypothetical protein